MRMFAANVCWRSMLADQPGRAGDYCYESEGRCGIPSSQEDGKLCTRDLDCQTGYCRTVGTPALCSVPHTGAPGSACERGQDCQEELFCAADHVCRSMPSQRARAKRRVELAAESAKVRRRRFLCSLPMSSCPVGSVGHFECIDTTSSLEHCGGCGTADGVDCSTLADQGAREVACIDSHCVICESFAACPSASPASR